MALFCQNRGEIWVGAVAKLGGGQGERKQPKLEANKKFCKERNLQTHIPEKQGEDRKA